MKIIAVLLIALLTVASCAKDNSSDKEDFILNFYPRKCNFLWAVFARQVSISYTGYTGYTLDYPLPGDNDVNEVVLIIQTSNLDTIPENFTSVTMAPYDFHAFLDEQFQNLEEHNLSLEKQLEDDYRNYNSGDNKKSAISNANVIRWEYRTTAIAGFSISSGTTLFGQAPGNELKNYFYISSLEPQQIISSETNQLIFGYSDVLGQMSINEWLEMHPMAQPTMRLMFKDIPEELPARVNFTVKVTTTDGHEIAYTSKDISLIP